MNSPLSGLPKLAERVSSLKPSATVEMSERIRQGRAAGRKIIGLSSGDPNLPTDPRIKSICEKISAHPADTSTADDWGALRGVTARTVHRLFIRETGMTFAQWREQARLLFALQRLANGERIIDVAFDCGYASQSAFTAMFRRHFGIPPSMFYR